MTRYEIIFNELTEKVESGELALEDAEVLNGIAYERYSNDDMEYEETVDDEHITYEEYLEAMEDELFNEGAFKKYRDSIRPLTDDFNDANKRSIVLIGKARDGANKIADKKTRKMINARNNYSDLVGETKTRTEYFPAEEPKKHKIFRKKTSTLEPESLTYKQRNINANIDDDNNQDEINRHYKYKKIHV